MAGYKPKIYSHNLCFYSWVWREDADLLFYFLRNLRKYHLEKIIVFSDGSTTKEQDLKLLTIFDLDLITVDNKKWLTEGANFLESRYQVLYNYGYDFYFKVEADDDFWRPLNLLFLEDIKEEFPWYGQVFKIPGQEYSGCWGGAMLLGKKTIERFLDSKKLDKVFTYKSVFGTTLFSEDDTIAHHLKLNPIKLYQVNLNRNFNRNFLSTRWPITHASLAKPIRDNLFNVFILPDRLLEEVSLPVFKFGYGKVNDIYNCREAINFPEYAIVLAENGNCYLLDGTLVYEDFSFEHYKDLVSTWYTYKTTAEKYRMIKSWTINNCLDWMKSLDKF